MTPQITQYQAASHIDELTATAREWRRTRLSGFARRRRAARR